jgi:predicted metalloenzyme YecM
LARKTKAWEEGIKARKASLKSEKRKLLNPTK